MSVVNQRLPVEGSQVLLRTEPNVSELCSFLSHTDPLLSSTAQRVFLLCGRFLFCVWRGGRGFDEESSNRTLPFRTNVLILYNC